MTNIEQRSVQAGAELRQVADRRAEAMDEAGAVVTAARRRGRLRAGGAVAGLVLLLAVVGALLPRDGVVVDPAGEATSWVWSQLPVGPVDGRHGAAVVWADDRLVVWGGEARQDVPADQGAVYDPAADSWNPTAASPLGPRAGHVAVWTGEQVVMCCGRGTEPDRPRAAAYDPADDRWQALPDPPIAETARMSTATLVDDQVLVLGENPSTDDGNSGVAIAYDLGSGSWQSVAVPIHAVGTDASATTADGHVYVWTDPAGMMAYNPRTDTWSTLPAPPQYPRRTDAAWTGTEWLVIGSRADQLVAVAFEPATSSWRNVDVPLPRAESFDGNLGSQAAVWTGTRLLVYTGALGSGLIGHDDAVMLSYDPATDTWDRLPDASTSAYDPPLIWTGTEALLYDEPTHALQPRHE